MRPMVMWIMYSRLGSQIEARPNVIFFESRPRAPRRAKKRGQQRRRRRATVMMGPTAMYQYDCSSPQC